MKDLLYKEFVLASHPTMYIFPFLGAMLLIPSYPYFVAFIYTCLGIFFIFLAGRENKDVFYTINLPVRKRDAVKARIWMIAIVEVFQVVISVPFAIIGILINPGRNGNEVGIEANVAFFGLVLVMFALFNIIFIPMVYKTAYKLGVPLIFGGIAITIFILTVEAAIQLVAPLKAFLDTTNPAMMLQQVPILAAGILIYVLSMFLTYKISAANFEKVDL